MNETSLAAIAAEQQQQRPGYFADPARNRMLQELLSLAEELCVARDRLDTALRLSAAGLVVDDKAIDAFEPEPDLLAERLERHRLLYTELFKRLD